MASISINDSCAIEQKNIWLNSALLMSETTQGKLNKKLGIYMEIVVKILCLNYGKKTVLVNILSESEGMIFNKVEFSKKYNVPTDYKHVLSDIEVMSINSPIIKRNLNYIKQKIIEGYLQLIFKKC